MAKAKAGKRQTTRKITLSLTEGEAELLLMLTGAIGGSRSKSPRKYGMRIYRALQEALGYGASETDAFHLGLGHIEFFDYDNHPDITESDRILAALTSVGTQLHADFDPVYQDVIVALGFFAMLADPDEDAAPEVLTGDEVLA